MRARRATFLLAALLNAVPAPLPAGASTWSVSIQAAVDTAPVQVQFQIDLADPIGSATVRLGSLPVVVSHTADTFSLAFGTTLPGGCLTTVFGGGMAAIQTTAGNAAASGTLSGGQVQSCSSGGQLVIVGSRTCDSYSYYCGGYRVPIYASTGGDTIVLNSTISGSFAASSQSVIPAAEVGPVSGTVTVRTPVSAGGFTPSTDLTPGVLIETGADGAATIIFRDGSQLEVSSNTLVTLPPLPDPTTIPSAVTLIKGRVRLVSAATAPPGATHTGVKTATATVVPTGTDFSTTYSQTNTLGSTTVAVQQGTVEVTNRRAERFSLLAGQQAVFDDTVPRVSLVLPVDTATIRAGQTNTFAWTRFPGGPAYLLEFTLAPGGFARANSATVEDPRNTIPVPVTFAQPDGLIEFPLPVPAGILPSGSRVQWRVFPVDAAGRILSGAVSSDASSVIVQ